MTIARKLWLGFGVLILLFAVACLVVFLSQRSIDTSLEEIVSVEEPTRAASFEVEINTVEISRDVLDYLETGEPRYREQFANDRADFDRFKARYDELVETREGGVLGDRIDSIYAEYVALGRALMDERAGQASDVDGLLREADAALYEAKGTGRNTVRAHPKDRNGAPLTSREPPGDTEMWSRTAPGTPVLSIVRRRAVYPPEQQDVGGAL
ncbi:MAG: hypothetical protein AVDCRST_MAG02-3915 [uncultured Rubrobacteraceae bacterium]|uniref:Chemotaxis methyl-accepting receptor HlyB-like 4HB MCP domain-containing protein n=1 Tax=uncultured Rubrobacteraceae bacterium TaxID=349277 RepID=A0A6J4RB59_9ACTN|nr:MAG: hypothetical protein AVDCRST_MAG02-3915 [uncultured Rubrobacteraceae bacterium]